jgi:hypothetical protein
MFDLKGYGAHAFLEQDLRKGALPVSCYLCSFSQGNGPLCEQGFRKVHFEIVYWHVNISNFQHLGPEVTSLAFSIVLTAPWPRHTL